MNWWIVSGLLAAAVVMMALEWRGVPTTLQLKFKGDLKRESHFLAQFGQAVATFVTAVLVYDFEGELLYKPLAIVATVFGTALIVYGIKRLTGRVRPNRENAGRFLGPTWRHQNWRESFPSSHSACAIALAVTLATLYPQAAATFWALGVATAVLRYLMDAHWPSDVLAGAAVGYVAGVYGLRAFGLA